MGCSNCFNGCAEIISDKCVKYTGVDIPELGIATGDPLLVIENQIINKILEIMTGIGIHPEILPGDLCPLVSSFLPVSLPITLNDVLSALIQTACVLDVRLTLTEDKVAEIEADYDISCLAGVTPTSGTHDILQATITKLCSVNTTLIALSSDLFANYVLIADINSYIAAYLAALPVTTLYNTRMIPYVAVPYFGTTVGIFDITGAGIGNWDKIYLCNGQNLTPDLRGRVLVGATTMGNTAFNPAVDPALPGNPSYALNNTAGSNQAVLTTVNQIPLHGHTATVVINDPQHSHPGSKINPTNGSGSELNYDSVGDKEHYGVMSTNPSFTGLKGTGVDQNVFVTVEPTGSSPSAGHPNIQPVHATNFIVYIP